VSKETGQRVRMFKDTLDANSRVVVANADQFHGKWSRAFDKKLTRKADFLNQVSYTMPGLPTSVFFMTTSGPFRTKSSPELRAQLIELPFSQNVSMIVVLPETQQDLEFLNENMTLAQLNQGIHDLLNSDLRPLTLTMPKFKLETDYDLKEPLQDFDLKTLFTDSADLSGLTGTAGQRVSTAVHKAVIEVNEDGEEPSGEEVGDRVRVDRPFVFLIRDNTSGLIAFIGRVQTLVDEELLSLGFI